jgi:hypothetical protein
MRTTTLRGLNKSRSGANATKPHASKQKFHQPKVHDVRKHATPIMMIHIKHGGR